MNYDPPESVKLETFISHTCSTLGDFSDAVKEAAKRLHHVKTRNPSHAAALIYREMAGPKGDWKEFATRLGFDPSRL